MTTITIDRALLEQALEALETCDAAHPSDGGQQWYDDKLVEPAITALRSALAQEQAEPVALTHRHEWFRTGGMEQGQFRCIHCGAWVREKSDE